MMVDEESMGHAHEKWSRFVATSKYFRSPPLTCRSEPCLRAAQHARHWRRGHALEPANLSLSWQLASNPADSSQLNDMIGRCVCAALAKQRRAVAVAVAKHGKRLKSSVSLMPKAKPRTKLPTRYHSPKSKVAANQPKIMVVDAVKRHAPAAKSHSSQPEPPPAAAAAAAASGGAAAARKQHKRQVRWEREERWRRELAGHTRPHAEVATGAGGKKPAAEKRRKYGVPLCHRPTTLLGPQYHAELQNYYQQQYYNQFLQQEQQRQQMMRNMLMYSQPGQLGGLQEVRYAVPIESMYHNMKKGKRYCGNFYYQ
ncbi:hypothetical protein KR093_010367 [Drosophila rubida]|uniref:Uncharacterized protein n=1 Tax=Drosophila rubida TaxID=30044 RepID=A0AAD4PQM1_9MUSC|nr:hypothetical protein KR093_010367 [Drosophila rubida]